MGALVHDSLKVLGVAMSVGVCLVTVLCLRLLEAAPQDSPARPDQGGIDLTQLLTRFVAATESYEKTFWNLTAEETKTLEMFTAKGTVDRRRVIVSDLVVYRSTRGTGATEFRDVHSVDGKAVDRRGDRALKLLTDASKRNSIERELEAIDRETHRYEFGLRIQGFTTRQRTGAWLEPPHEAFHVEMAGREQIGGREVIVLDFRQIGPRANPLRPQNLPREFGKVAESYVRGRLWLDAATGELWREQWEETVPHPATPEPLVLVRGERTYRPSELGILVPERLRADTLTHFSHPKSGRPSFALSARTTFTYDAFRRFQVTAEEQLTAPDGTR